MIRLYKKADYDHIVHIDSEFQFLDTERYIVKVIIPFGYIAYRFESKNVRIKRLRVASEHRNLGIGTELLGSVSRCKKIMIVVHETNEHLNWLLARGFLAVCVVWEHFPDGRDGILFEKVL